MANITSGSVGGPMRWSTAGSLPCYPDSFHRPGARIDVGPSLLSAFADFLDRALESPLPADDVNARRNARESELAVGAERRKDRHARRHRLVLVDEERACRPRQGRRLGRIDPTRDADGPRQADHA